MHSPFAFSFINDVVEEKNLFYGYKEIADKLRLRKKSISLPGAINLKNNLFLFRLSNYYRFKSAIMVGCESESSIFYLQGGNPKTQCTLIESDKTKASSAIHLAEGEQNIRVYDTSDEEVFSDFETQILKIGHTDLVYIHHAISNATKQNILNVCSKFRKEQTVIILDGIYSSKEMIQMWKSAIAKPYISVSFDLIALGVLVINPKLNKQDYKLFF